MTKIITTKEIKKIQSKLDTSKHRWFEGVDNRQLWVFLSTGMPHIPQYYWKEADSYIFNNNDTWVCVSRYYWKK